MPVEAPLNADSVSSDVNVDVFVFIPAYFLLFFNFLKASFYVSKSEIVFL